VLRCGWALILVVRRHFWACGISLLFVLLLGATAGGYLYFRFELDAAERCIRAEKYPEARTHVNRALGIWPWNASTHLFAARIERLNGDYPQAEAHLKECNRLLGGPQETTQLEWLLLRAESGELDKVAPGLEYAVEQDDPRKLEILEALTRASMRKMYFQRTLHYLDLWLELEPDNVRALDWRGWTYSHLSKPNEAVNDEEHVLQLSPDRSAVRVRLIDHYLDRKATQAALPHAQYLVQTQPNNPDGLVALARCRLLLAQSEQGEELLRHALAVDPEHVGALMEMAKIANRSGRPADAEGFAKRAIAKSDANAELLFILCESFRLQGIESSEVDEWKARYDKVKADLDFVDAFIRKDAERPGLTAAEAAEAGATFMRLKEDRLGVQWLTAALKLDRQNTKAHMLLADYFEKKGDAEEARYHREFLRGGRAALGGVVGCPIAACPWGKQPDPR
jgi:Tfp pilus assembly protein PilF